MQTNMYDMRQQQQQTLSVCHHKLQSRMNRVRINANLILFVLYALVLWVTVIDAGLVRRDEGAASLSTLAGNGTTETPATTAALHQHAPENLVVTGAYFEFGSSDANHRTSDELMASVVHSDDLLPAHDETEGDFGILDNDKVHSEETHDALNESGNSSSKATVAAVTPSTSLTTEAISTQEPSSQAIQINTAPVTHASKHRNKSGDTENSLNDIKDEFTKVKNHTQLTVPIHEASTNVTTFAALTAVEGTNEKRPKSLHDIEANVTFSHDDLITHKVVGEVDNNNVTSLRSNETEEALRRMAYLVEQLEHSNITTPFLLESSTENIIHEPLLHNNASRIDDIVHQDISIVPTTTVVPRTAPHRIASITSKEVAHHRASGDTTVFNAARANEVSKVRIVKDENDQNASTLVGTETTATTEVTDQSTDGIRRSDEIHISDTFMTIAPPEVAAVTDARPSTTTDSPWTEADYMTTTETPDFTTTIDELIARELVEHHTVAVSKTSEHSIPKRTVAKDDYAVTTIAPDVETTQGYTTTIANRINEIEEPQTTIAPETTMLATSTSTASSSQVPVETSAASSTVTTTPSTTTSIRNSPTTTASTSTTQSTTLLASTTTTRPPVTPSKMKLEISTTHIDLNRQEDKYNTEVDQPDRTGVSSTPASSSTTFLDPMEEITYDSSPSSETPSPINSGLDVNEIVAISVSVIGVIALILLVGFLLLMRKRQKQPYGQRCRPVGLDAYSMDNVSIYNSVRRKGAARSSKRAYGNVGFDDPGLKNNLLNMSALAAYVQRKSAIYEEFKEVPAVTARIDEVPAGCEDKNRYANVVPLPESRVMLKRLDDDDRTEYINANFVRGPKDTTHYYIACQAPMDNTIVDYWRMIWEHNSRVIIMATDLTENGIEKCADYMPPSFVIDNHVVFGDYQVILKNREVKEKYAVSTIHLKNSVTKTWREITHLWYQWPDSGIPTDEASLIAMLLETRSYLKMNLPEQSSDDVQESGNHDMGNGSMDKHKSLQRVQGPLTVHCSPGTGRTGTIIACDIAIRSLEQPARSVDIPQIVYVVRRGRASAVQTREQYEFIYKVAHVYATKLAGPISDS